MRNASSWFYRFIEVAVAVLALTILWPGGNSRAWAWEAEDCMACHADPSIVEEGGAYLYVDPARYERTAHAEVGCPSCHETVSEDHPYDGLRPSRAKCGECHDDVEAEYAQSSHAANAACTDCHDPHKVRPVAGVSGAEMNQTCMKCHEEGDVFAFHGEWLPQTALHIQALPCIACHTGSEEYVITFYIEPFEGKAGLASGQMVATYGELKAMAGGSDGVTAFIDQDGNGEVSVEELRTFYRRVRASGMRLWGMMTPEIATHNYTTLDNRWDCSFCHASGPGTIQKSFLALPGEGGDYSRIPMEPGAVLEALYGTPDFYMIGSTRSKTLSALGLLIVVGGLAVPLVHGSLRLLTMHKRREH